MKTVQKTICELQPGDVIVRQKIRASVVGMLRPDGKVAICLLDGSQTLMDAEFIGTMAVECANLTPAQQHADEMLALMRMAAAGLPRAAGAIGIANDMCALIDKIDPPQPPTLDEALQALADVIANSDMSEGASIVKLDAAQAVLDRARRSGVLK